MKTLGVIGGMGPAATTAFIGRLQALTPAASDADHIRILADINPQVPDRNSQPGEAEAELSRMAARLRDMGAEVLAMPCNTAHAQAAGIRAAGLPFIDMITATVVAAKASGATRIGVLATPGGEALYLQTLRASDLEAVVMEPQEREAFMARIYGVKAGDVSDAARKRMKELAAALVARGAGALIAGCTEVPLLLGQGDVTAPLIDSTDVLAAACVSACTG